MATCQHDYITKEGTKISIKHESEAVPILKDFFSTLDIELIVELGTYVGGFTILLEESCNAEIHSFDYYPEHLKSMEKYIGIFTKTTFYLEDILSHPNERVIELLKSPRNKLLYCDNGKKPLEMNMYGRYLNIGDYIGVHDWDVEVHWEQVMGLLTVFKACSVNKIFESMKLRSRFWIRKK
jgi:hypothetical protein